VEHSHSRSSLERVCWVWIDWQRPNKKKTQILVVAVSQKQQQQHQHKDVSIAGATKLQWLPVSSISNIQWMFDAISDVIILISRHQSEGDLVEILISRNNSLPLVRVAVVVATTIDEVVMATITIIMTITIRAIDGTIAAVDLESPVHRVEVVVIEALRTINLGAEGKDSTIRMVVIEVAAEIRIDRVVVTIPTIRTAVHVTTVSSHLTDVTTTTATTTIPIVMDQDDDEAPRPTLTIGDNHK
jgi:hypothetical protein